MIVTYTIARFVLDFAQFVHIRNIKHMNIAKNVIQLLHTIQRILNKVLDIAIIKSIDNKLIRLGLFKAIILIP